MSLMQEELVRHWYDEAGVIKFCVMYFKAYLSQTACPHWQIQQRISFRRDLSKSQVVHSFKGWAIIKTTARESISERALCFLSHACPFWEMHNPNQQQLKSVHLSKLLLMDANLFKSVNDFFALIQCSSPFSGSSHFGCLQFSLSATF